MNMALSTAVKEGDLVKTMSILEDETGDAKLVMLHSVDPDGKTPLHIASEEGHIDLVKYMTDLGADLEKRSRNGDAPIHYASRSGRLSVAQYLIGKGADINVGDSNGYTPLYLASDEGHFGVVECLVNSGADINKGSYDGSTPLYTSARKGRLHVVKYLITNGADMTLKGHEGKTSLSTAASCGHLDVVKYLLTEGAEINMEDNKKYAPLHAASKEGHLQVVEYLVNAGADVEKAAKNGETPLFTASDNGDLDVVKYLISKGANPNSVDNDGYTPLSIASLEGHLDVVECLVNAGADVNKAIENGLTALYTASYKGHVDIVKYIISKGGNLNSVHVDCYTPLSIASQKGHLDFVECLVNAGADVEKAAKNGKTPLFAASENGAVDIAKYLISKGANPNSVHKDCYTPLSIASGEGHLDVVECLVNAGADVKKAAIDGDLPLHAASRRGYHDIIKYLITKGADILARNNVGWTVFHFAADNGHLESLEYFLRNNTSGTSGNSHNTLEVGFQTLQGVTPLMAAARGGHLDCVRMLLENNADIEKEDSEGWTTLHYAAASGNESIMRYLLDRKAIMSTRLSRRGQSPISIALNSGNADTARILLDKDVSSIHHIDSAGLTPIHLATVSGLTSIIENLVSLGAGLNPQSYDDQTPLHVAIRLCHCKKRQVEVTPALKQIQQESDDDISPAEALVQFLINQGSKIDIKDNNGFTPVQYAREERVRQMVFRSLSRDDVHTFRDLPIARSTESHCSIGCEGGILHLDSCDVTMSIPPRTVQAGSCHDVSLALVTDDPPPIREGEFLTGHGIGITFPAQWRYSQNQPITLSLPHATLLKSNGVHAEIIWKQTESTSVHRNSSFDDSETQCVIKEREINLVIDATSVIENKVQLWIPIRRYHTLGKRIACTPFLPVDMAHGEDITLRIYIHEDIPYIVQKIQEEEENLLYRQVHPGRCFALEPESSNLELECNGGKKIISTTELFNRQKALFSMPITTETNAKTQMMNISISATSTSQPKTSQPKTSMAFMAIRTGFSTDIHSTLDEMVSRSNTDLSISIDSNADEIRSDDFITKEINTDQYYHLGLALGMSYETLDSIQFRSRQHEEAGVYTPNQKAALIMIRYWKRLQHSVSLADDHLREVWKSVSESGAPDSAPVLKQRRRAEKKHDINVEEFSEGEFPPEEPRTIPTVGLHAYEVEIPGARRYWTERLQHKRSNTPSVRSDSLSSFSTLLEEEEEEDRFPKRYRAHIPGSARAHKRTFSTSRHIRDRVNRVLSIDEHHLDEEKEHSKQAILAWMESGEGVKPADFRHHEYTATPSDDEGQIIGSVRHISSPSALQDGTEVTIPPNEAYSTTDVTFELIDDIPASSAAREVFTSSYRALSVDEQHEDEDKYHSEGIFDQTGGELNIPSYGLTLSIPPGALPEGSVETITLDALTDIPPEITLRHDETLVTYGFQCLPSGLQFVSENPVRLKMPHCANLIDPTKVQVVLYSMNHAGEGVRIAQTPRTCRVTYNHVEIVLEHFSRGLLAFIKDPFSMKDKRMSFMPFLPKIMPQCREMMLEFRMVNKPHANSWRDLHDIREKAEYRPAKDDDDEMNVKPKDMEVTCQLSNNDTLTENVDASFIRKTKHTFYFELDFNGKADDLPVKLKVKQSKRQMDIKFRTHFLASRGITETSPGKTDSTSPRPSASTPIDIPLQGAAAAADDVYTSKSIPTVESTEQNFDDLLKTVAEQIHKDSDIDNLGVKLGTIPPDIKRYIQMNKQDHTYIGTLEMLRDWRHKTKRSEEREKLNKALIAINHHRLADDLLKDDMHIYPK